MRVLTPAVRASDLNCQSETKIVTLVTIIVTALQHELLHQFGALPKRDSRRPSHVERSTSVHTQMLQRRIPVGGPSADRASPA